MRSNDRLGIKLAPKADNVFGAKLFIRYSAVQLFLCEPNGTVKPTNALKHLVLLPKYM